MSRQFATNVTTIYDIFCPVPFLPSPFGFCRLKNFNLDRNFNLRFVAWKFQSRRDILNLFNLGALWECLPAFPHYELPPPPDHPCRSWGLGRGSAQKNRFFGFGDSLSDWMAPISSVNCLSKRSPLHSVKSTLFFTDFCFFQVGSSWLLPHRAHLAFVSTCASDRLAAHQGNSLNFSLRGLPCKP